MAITRGKKETQLAAYAENIDNSSALFVTTYKGLSVNDMNALRQKIREANGSYTVIKNTLAKRALQDAEMAGLDDLLEGQIGTTFCFGDPPPVAKALVDFADDNDALQIKGGLLDGTILDAKGIEALADLPPMEVIRAQLLGILSAPASQLTGVVASSVRQVVNVVNAYADSGEGESASA